MLITQTKALKVNMTLSPTFFNSLNTQISVVEHLITPDSLGLRAAAQQLFQTPHGSKTEPSDNKLFMV